MHDLFDICEYESETDTSIMPQMPLIGDAAPEFTANTTNGVINFPGDYAGRWVILFSHPSDFTPVCTSEFMAFQARMDDFRALNTDLVGLSVGTLTSHIAWLNAIQNMRFNGWDNIKITFPVIDDTKMHVAKMYGMIHPNASDTHAVRAVFIIDTKGVIRAILYYPASTGRNFDEIMRMLVALQTADTFKVSTPADWMPGEDVLVSAPSTTDGMRQVLSNGERGADVHSWFLISKKLDEDTIMSRLHRGGASGARGAAKKK